MPLTLPLRAAVEEAVIATQGVLVGEKVLFPPGLALPAAVEEALPVDAPVSVPPPPRLAVPDTLADPVPAAVRLCVKDGVGELQTVPVRLALALALGQRLGEVEGDAHGVAVALADCEPSRLAVGGLSLGEAEALPRCGLGVTAPEGQAVELVEEEGHVELEMDTVPLALPMGDRDMLAVVLELPEALRGKEGVMESDVLRVGQGEAQGEEVEEEECDCEPVVLPVLEAEEGCETDASAEVEGAVEGDTVVPGERVAAAAEGEVLGDQVSEGGGEGVPGRDALASPLALPLLVGEDVALREKVSVPLAQGVALGVEEKEKLEDAVPAALPEAEAQELPAGLALAFPVPEMVGEGEVEALPLAEGVAEELRVAEEHALPDGGALGVRLVAALVLPLKLGLPDAVRTALFELQVVAEAGPLMEGSLLGVAKED